MSGAEMAREKEKVAAKMREKQAAGTSCIIYSILPSQCYLRKQQLTYAPADARKKAEGDSKTVKK